MATVRDILAIKGAYVHSIGPEATILEAAKRMSENCIGALVVLEAGELIGIITERDLLARVIVQRREPAGTLVEDIMTQKVVCCDVCNTLDEVRGVMKNLRIRHLPVSDDGRRLLGLVSIGDLNAQSAHEREVTLHVMEEYISGRA